MPALRANGLDLAFDSFGDPDAQPVLLIAGLGTQMIRWTDAFCTNFAGRGFRVVRFDNRDSGLSTIFSEAAPPDLGALLAGQKPEVPYTLSDMAADAIGVLDGLGVERAHLVGRSMGGMIAQLVAVTYPERVLSLTSFMATSGNPDLPSPAPDVMAMMMAPTPDPVGDEQGFLDHRVAFARRIAAPGLPFDEAGHRALALAELRRGWEPAALGRQIAAIAMDGDRRARLARVTAPALVIHGSEDPLFPLAHGRDTGTANPASQCAGLGAPWGDAPGSVLHLWCSCLDHYLRVAPFFRANENWLFRAEQAEAAQPARSLLAHRARRFLK